LWDPNAVIVGRAAAALSFGVTGSVPTIDVMMAHWTRLPRGYRCHKGRVPVRERVDYQGATRSSAAWTAVWMAARDDGEAIETALRARIVTPKDLTRVCALMARKPGQRLRRFVVAASQHSPWSAAERLAHRILLDAGISDFQGNCQVTIGDASWPIDIAMTKLRLAMEIDGFEYHQDRKTFEWDHEKADRLVEEGWTVVRITWSMLQDQGPVPHTGPQGDGSGRIPTGDHAAQAPLTSATLRGRPTGGSGPRMARTGPGARDSGRFEHQ